MIARYFTDAALALSIISLCAGDARAERYKDNLFWLMSSAQKFKDKNHTYPKTFYELSTPVPCSAVEVDTAYPHSGLKDVWSPEICGYSYSIFIKKDFSAFCAKDALGKVVGYIDSTMNLREYMNPKARPMPPANHRC